MTDRIDRYLEGRLGKDALTAAERVEADLASRAAAETRAFMAAKPAPDVTDAVMQRVNQMSLPESSHRAGLLARMWQQLWVPRRVSIRPAYGLAAAGAIVAALIALPSTPRSQDELQGGAADARLFVQFRIQTAAMNVQLAGSFTNWTPAYELLQAAPGIWTITVPLSPGVHDYAFVVDGRQWIPDPYAPQIDDGFGGTNSRLTLLVPEEPRT
jgi:hypothetical protein